MPSELLPADKHVIESLIVQVRTWRELSAGWSWQKAGCDLQQRCAELVGIVRANAGEMMVAAEAEELMVRLHVIGEHLERFDDFANEVLGGDPDEIDMEYRVQMADVDSIVGEARELSPAKPLDEDGLSVRTYKNYKLLKPILQSASPLKIKDEDVFNEMLRRELIKPDVKLGTFNKRLQRGREVVEEQTKLTRADKIRGSRIIQRKPIIGKRLAGDDDFHDDDEFEDNIE